MYLARFIYIIFNRDKNLQKKEDLLIPLLFSSSSSSFDNDNMKIELISASFSFIFRNSPEGTNYIIIIIIH